jgi:hypothetical protein
MLVNAHVVAGHKTAFHNMLCLAKNFKKSFFHRVIHKLVRAVVAGGTKGQITLGDDVEGL